MRIDFHKIKLIFIAILAIIVCLLIIGYKIGFKNEQNNQSKNIDNKITILNKYGYGVNSHVLENTKELDIKYWLNSQIDKQVITKAPVVFKNQDEFIIKYKELFLTDKKNKMDKEFLYGDTGLINKNLKTRIQMSLENENKIEEMMHWFWFNHFNIGVYSSATSVMFLNDYELMLRKNGMGNFKDLLKDVMMHPAMLGYLNNVDNNVSASANNLNENYARELLELHTMGVDGGYTQDDVINVAKTLTGFGAALVSKCYNCNWNNVNSYKSYISEFEKNLNKDNSKIEGMFVFNGNNHIYKDKVVLGERIKGRGFDELDQLIDIVTKQKATSEFISKKIAIYFLGDSPSEVIIGKMAKKFRETNGNIREVLKTMFNNTDEKDLLIKNKYKDAYTYVVSTLNLIVKKEGVEAGIDVGAKFLTKVEANPYFKDTPNGFSVYGKDWFNTGRLSGHIKFIDELLKVIGKDKINYDFLKENLKINNEKELVVYLLSEEWLKR